MVAGKTGNHGTAAACSVVVDIDLEKGAVMLQFQNMVVDSVEMVKDVTLI